MQRPQCAGQQGQEPEYRDQRGSDKAQVRARGSGANEGVAQSQRKRANTAPQMDNVQNF